MEFISTKILVCRRHTIEAAVKKAIQIYKMMKQ